MSFWEEITYAPNGEILRIIAEDENGKRKFLLDKLPLIIEIEETE